MKYLKTGVEVFFFLLSVYVLAYLFYLLSPGGDQAYPSFGQAIFGAVGQWLLRAFQYPLALIHPDYPFFLSKAEVDIPWLVLLSLANAAVQTLILVGGYFLLKPRFID